MAKNKVIAGGYVGGRVSSAIVAVKFKDGKESLLEVDDKNYKSIAKRCF